MKQLFCFVLCWCLVCSLASNLLATNGNELLEYCQTALTEAPGDASSIGYCFGYVGGASDALPWDFCPPEGVDGEQRIRVVVKYLEDNPKVLHHNAADLIHMAFLEAFPCAEGE